MRHTTPAGSYRTEVEQSGVLAVRFHDTQGRPVFRAGYVVGGGRVWLAESHQRTIGYFKSRAAAFVAVITAVTTTGAAP